MPLGPVMLDVAGIELNAEDRELLMHPVVGGVILFARNYHDTEQLAALTASIRSLRTPPLLIAVDQEGGRVQRFREGFKRLPPAGYFGRLYRNSPHTACRAASLLGWLMASELQSAGVDFSFAPVLDIDRGICKAIGDRAFSSEVQTIKELGSAWMQGVRMAGMASVGKHFPGHGGVAVDSHLDLPRDGRSFDTLLREDLAPFQALVNQGLEAVMPAHVVYPAVDAVPAGFSSRWLQEILRGRMGFQGVIISDALDMAAAASVGSDVERSQAALAAGCDQLLVCNNRVAAIQVVEALADYCDPLAQSRLLRLYSRHFTTHSKLQENPYWIEAIAVLGQLEAAANAELAYDPTTRGGTVI